MENMRLIGILIGVFGLLASVIPLKDEDIQPEIEDNIFFYFAYGCNMLEKRMRAKTGRAVFHSQALLKRHRLDFTMEVAYWNGAVATICKDNSQSVWGVLWIMKWADKKKLDEEQGVLMGWYHTEIVTVWTPNGREMTALTFVQNHNPRKVKLGHKRPPERKPSATYLRIMILGAMQAGIPYDYIRFLHSVPTNGKLAPISTLQELGSPFTDGGRYRKIDIRVYR